MKLETFLKMNLLPLLLWLRSQTNTSCHQVTTAEGSGVRFDCAVCRQHAKQLELTKHEV